MKCASRPKIGKYYTIYFYRFGQWTRQPGEAKCITYFRMWQDYNHGMKIEEIPIFYYKDSFLSAKDCRWE
jgi:hypothetical protein